MSDDEKKRDRALQRRVRERQAKTGESYQAAWRQLTGSEAPIEEPPLDPDEGALPPIPAGMDIFKAVTEEWQQKMEEDDFVVRGSLSLHHPHVPPRQTTRVAVKATRGAIDITRIHISGAGTKGGAADWVVNDIEVDGRSQIAMKDLSGALFGASGVASNPRAFTTFSLNGFDPVEHDRELAIVVTYIGANPEGAPFFASAIGTPPPQRPTVVPIASTDPLPPATITITARVLNASFQMQRLEISDDNTLNGSADWLVEDLRINGKSQFCLPGAVPGDMFATSAINSFVKMETCEVGSAIEIDAHYIGLNKNGAIFAARLEGTVIRDDYKAAPPDLRVVVETAGQGSGREVIATCNWRPPAPKRAAPQGMPNTPT